ncbi:MAG: hypothetical protein M3R38_34100 [Actinomycetota bacterium]|nr:hypothetical protein [Actinomycetota bacterium]
MTRTVVKANYVRLGGPAGGAAARGKIRASAGYYGHRPDEDGRREWRDAFTEGRDRLDKGESYEQVREAEGEYAYRIVLSPGRQMDDGELMSWTREVMASGSERGWWRDRGLLDQDHGPPDAWDHAGAGWSSEGVDLGGEHEALREALAGFGGEWAERHYDDPDWHRHSEGRREWLEGHAERLGVSYDYLEDLTYRCSPHEGEEELRALFEHREMMRHRESSSEDREEEAERWIGWAHTDHTENPHVHVLAFTDRRLDREDFAGMREEGDLAAEERLDWRAEVERDPMRGEEMALGESRDGREHEEEPGRAEEERRTLAREELEQGVDS